MITYLFFTTIFTTIFSTFFLASSLPFPIAEGAKTLVPIVPIVTIVTAAPARGTTARAVCKEKSQYTESRRAIPIHLIVRPLRRMQFGLTKH